MLSSFHYVRVLGILDDLQEIWKNAFDWKGCVLNHFTVGIHGTVLEYLQVPGYFSSTQPKVSVGIRKEVKCCQVVLSPQHSQSPILLR